MRCPRTARTARQHFHTLDDGVGRGAVVHTLLLTPNIETHTESPGPLQEAGVKEGWRLLAVDGGELPGRRGSTIVDVTGSHPKILRNGDLELELPPEP